MLYNPMLWNDEHEHIEGLLPEYAHSITLGHVVDGHAQHVINHLERCPACRAKLFDLIDASYAFYHNALPNVTAPKPNLGFLQPTHAPVHDDHMFVVQFSDALLEAISQSRPVFGYVRGARRLIGTYRQSTINIPDVKIEIYETEAQCAALRCHIHVSHKDEFDQSGTDIVVYADGQNWRGVTDEIGFVEVQGIPIRAIPQMRIEILTA